MPLFLYQFIGARSIALGHKFTADFTPFNADPFLQIEQIVKVLQAPS